MTDARMPGPVYRDVHPDWEIVALYNPDGTVSIESDQPSAMMKQARQAARQNGVCVAELLIGILQDHADRRARGF